MFRVEGLWERVVFGAVGFCMLSLVSVPEAILE